MSKRTTNFLGSRNTRRPNHPRRQQPGSGSRPEHIEDGFIESADFSPEWLKTQTQEPKPPVVGDNQPSQPPPSIEVTDSFVSRQEALERFYANESLAPPSLSEDEAEALQDIYPLTTSLPLVEQTGAIPELTEEARDAAEQAPATQEAESILLEQLAAALRSGHQSAESTPPSSPPIFTTLDLPEEQAPQVEPATTPAEMTTSAATSSAAGPTMRPSKRSTPPAAGAAASVATAKGVTSPPGSPKPVATTPPRKRPKRQRTRKAWREGEVQRIPVRLLDRFAKVAIGLMIVLGLLTLVILQLNPFAYLALQSATVARPQTQRESNGIPTAGVTWCLIGDIPGADASNVRFNDNGDQGDIVAGDGIFSLNYAIAVPGTYQWQVAPCNDLQTLFPPTPAWVVTTEPEQRVTFTMDMTQINTPRFVAARHVASVTDSASEFQVVGDFQNWNPNDPVSKLQPIGLGIYQQVRRISELGRYNAYVIAQGAADGTTMTAIDGFGRTTQPIPLSFRTLRRSDVVVIRLDTNQGRMTILYNMLPILARMAFQGGNFVVGAITGTITFLIIAWLLVRSLLLWRHGSWLDAGCPRCHQHELVRIERQPIDRLLNVLGLPAYRYQCRHCIWEGGRLSFGGLSASPRSRLAQTARRERLGSG